MHFRFIGNVSCIRRNVQVTASKFTDQINYRDCNENCVCNVFHGAATEREQYLSVSPQKVEAIQRFMKPNDKNNPAFHFHRQ